MTTPPPSRIVFMGSDPIALPLLEALRTQEACSVELVAIYTQPDRPHGRGLKTAPNAIKQWALAHAIPVRQPERCGAEDNAWLAAARIDLVLVMAYGQLLRRAFIGIPPRGVINFHASLLPRLRGASPIHTAIATGESTTGVTLMRIVPALDAGPTLDAESFPISLEAQAEDVITQMAAACVPLLERNLASLCDGHATFTPQNDAEATYCRKISREDARLDFFQSARRLHDHIRAFQPWPGAELDLESEIIRVRRARVVPATGGDPGTLLVEDSRAFLQCGDDALELLTLQRPGGRPLPTADFLRGHPLPSGLQARSYGMAELVTKKD